jgi:hypothetical protein
MNSRFGGIIISLILIALGLWTRYTKEEGWRKAKPYWPYLVIIGTINLIFASCVVIHELI